MAHQGRDPGGQGQVRGVLVELDLTELPELVPGFFLPYCLGWLLSEGEGSGGTQALGKVRGGPMIQIHGQDQRFDLALFGQDLCGRGLPGGDDADLLRLVQVGKAAGRRNRRPDNRRGGEKASGEGVETDA